MAASSGAAEHTAKSYSDLKNSISMFYDESKKYLQASLDHKERYALAMPWETGNKYIMELMRVLTRLGELTDNGKDMRKIFKLKNVSSQTIEKWFNVAETYYYSGEIYLPTMARVLNDVKNSINKNNEDAGLFQKLLQCLYEHKSSNIPHLHVALNWLSYLRRIR